MLCRSTISPKLCPEKTHPLIAEPTWPSIHASFHDHEAIFLAYHHRAAVVFKTHHSMLLRSDRRWPTHGIFWSIQRSAQPDCWQSVWPGPPYSIGWSTELRFDFTGCLQYSRISEVQYHLNVPKVCNSSNYYSFSRYSFILDRQLMHEKTENFLKSHNSCGERVLFILSRKRLKGEYFPSRSFLHLLIEAYA